MTKKKNQSISIGKLDFIKVKKFCASKDTFKRMKSHLIEWKKYLQIVLSAKRLYLEYIKNT